MSVALPCCGCVAIAKVSAWFSASLATSCADPSTSSLVERVWVANVGAVFTGVAWLIAVAIIHQTSIRPNEITDRGVLLTNVSDYFIDALEDERDRDEQERSPPPRRRAWDDEDDADEEGYWEQKTRGRSRPRPRRGRDDEDEYRDREPDDRYRPPPRRRNWDEEEDE